MLKAECESFYRDVIASALNGTTEVETPVGRIDVLTASEIIEVKRCEQWKAALGQIVAYGVYYPSHRKRIHLLGEPNENARRICSENDVFLTWQPVVFATPAVNEEEAEISVSDLNCHDVCSIAVVRRVQAVNRRLKAEKRRVAIEIQGGWLYLRGTFPPKPSDLFQKRKATVSAGRNRRASLPPKRSYSTKIALHLPASLFALTKAEKMAEQVSVELHEQTFDWLALDRYIKLASDG